MRKVILAVILLVGIGCLGYLMRGGVHFDGLRTRSANDTVAFHPLRFQDKQLFDRAVIKTREKETKNSAILGGIVPHHLLASEVIAQVFSQASFQPVKTVILLSPNHYELGKDPFLTSDYQWETPYGRVPPDMEMIDTLAVGDWLTIKPDVLAGEHGLGGIMPFIKYYLPDAAVVPIAISRRATDQQLDDLAQRLAELMKKEKMIVISSVDFSHYLPAAEAVAKDEESLMAIEANDLQRISHFENDHLDSPGAIRVLLQVMDQLDQKKPEVIDHTNSGKLLNDYTSGVTSYFGIVYR